MKDSHDSFSATKMERKKESRKNQRSGGMMSDMTHIILEDSLRDLFLLLTDSLI